MFENKNILAIIPARAGSKGVKGKNKKILAGKPLISWTIEEALKSRYIDKIVVTTDDLDILELSKEYKITPIKREEKLAQDNTPMIDVILHVLEKFSSFDYVLLLQPTSPLRTVEDIDKGIETIIKENYDSLIAITESAKHPFWMLYMEENSKLTPFDERINSYKRRQDLPPIYFINGSIYISKRELLIEKKTFFHDKTHGMITDPEKSTDIDTEKDFLMAEFLLKNRAQN